MKRRIYLKTLTHDEALVKINETFGGGRRTEILPLGEALGRLTAEAVYAKRSNPHYHASAMDGIALRASLTEDVHERNPLRLSPGIDAHVVDTGDVLPEACDAVVMIEDVTRDGDGYFVIISRAHPWQHVRLAGEDMAEGDLILPSNQRVTPESIGALVAGGITHLTVYKKPHVTVIPTGNEIRPAGTDVAPGEILDGNGPMLEALALREGATVDRLEAVADDPVILRQSLQRALERSDLVIVNAGSSAGTEDYTASVIEELGDLVFHGVAIKPGKPVMLGKVGGAAILGLPGYPVSCYLAFRLFARPIIAALSNSELPPEEDVRATLTRRVHSSLKHREYVRVKLGRVNGRLLATPLDRGAGSTMSLMRADGVLVVPLASEGIEQGTEVTITLLRPIDQIDHQLLVMGSHDILIDELSELMNPYALNATHVGSMGGIMAMKRGEANLAGIHLLDPEQGTYNREAVKKYLGEGFCLIRGIKREQGLYVREDLEEKISGITDLARKTLRFANRQRGAGTRVLLDHLLKSGEIDRSEAATGDLVLTTHTAVGLSVQSGQADVGLGIKSVALRYGLRFIPVAEEDYDFVLRCEDLKEERIDRLLAVMKSDAFAARLDTIGGYRLDEITVERIGGSD